VHGPQQIPQSGSPLARYLREPLVFGTICGLFSAVGYTAANVCLRAVSHCDPVWVSTVKAAPTVILFAPWLIWLWRRGERIIPTRRVLGILLIASLVCQLFGNVAFQWSLGIVGIALTVPLTLGTMIIAGAVMGRVYLHESVTLRMAVSLLILIVAICVLSLGAGEASSSILPDTSSFSIWLVMAGVALACLSGVAYALLGVVIRYGVTGRVSVASTLVIVTLTGVVALGALSVGKIGWQAMLSTGSRDFLVMAGAGLFNALAFLALTKSLQFVPVVYVNALNATQATMAALAGIWFFSEPSSAALWVGVFLTAVGLVLMQKRRAPAPEIEEQPLIHEPA
jgi:drug/metabolite transporter (DMT)-like permease